MRTGAAAWLAIAVIAAGCQGAAVRPTQTNPAQPTMATPTPVPAGTTPTPGPSGTVTPTNPHSVPSEPTARPTPTIDPSADRDSDFQLIVTTDRDQYRAGDIIEAFGQVTYVGKKAGVDTSGLVPAVIGFGLRQLDGSIGYEADWGLACSDGPRLVRNEPFQLAFYKATNWSGDDPNKDWYRTFADDQKFRLTQGTWLITATFMAGPDGSRCQDWNVQATKQIVVD